jgi:hypothetical protein
MKYCSFKKYIIIFLIVFIIPLFVEAAKDDLISIEPTKDSEINRYINSAENIVKIVNKDIIFLSGLNMVGETVIEAVLLKFNNYNSFIDKYSPKIEKEGASLFDDLMNGYKSTRKYFHLINDIDSLSSSMEIAYELLNTTDVFLEENSKKGSSFKESEKSLEEFRESLNKKTFLVESLILEVLANVNINQDSYEDDLDYLNYYKKEMQEIKDSYLEVSNSIIDLSERVIES